MYKVELALQRWHYYNAVSAINTESYINYKRRYVKQDIINN